MPQMAPISWLSLFIIFTITFMIFNMMNYYLYTPTTPKLHHTTKNKIMFNWKW